MPYFCPNYDNQKSAWEAVLIAVCCIGFQLHWITFIILQLPCALDCHCFYPIEYHCISPMSLHCTSLHYIALDESKRRPRLSHQICCPSLPLPVLLLLIFVVVVFDIVNFFVIINVVDELSRPSIHKLAIANLMLSLRLFLVLISVLMFIVISYSEVFCR